jgi:crotonobetaine/carnitine-CoA ligase
LLWAGALRRAGVETGTHVAPMLPNIFDGHRTLLALGWLRAVEVPINTAYTGSMLRYALDLADVTVLVTVGEYLPRVEAIAPDLTKLTTIVVLDASSTAAQLPFRMIDRDDLLTGATPATDLTGPHYWDLAALLFTSGTTGPSKAVRTPWGLIHQFWGWVPEDTVGPGEGLFCALPLFHNSGRGGFNYTLTRGARFVIRDKFSATRVWDDTRRTDCVALALVGPLTSLLYSAPPRPDDADNPVKHVILGPMIPEMEDFEARFGVRVCISYGQTEIGCPIATGWDHGPWANCGRVRQGHPWPEVRIVDEHDEPVGPGVVGEMIVRTSEPWCLNVGYHNMPEQTAEAWRNGWFHTGDALKYDEEGQYYFVDRVRDAIRRRGENISSFEVENFVCEYPDVLECAAIGITTPHGDHEVMVAVVVVDEGRFDPVALIEFLVPRMPRFMLPRYVQIVADLPRSEASARVRKQALRAQGVTERTWDREAAGVQV